MASFFSFGSPIEVDVRLDSSEERQQVEVKLDKDRKESCAVYYDGESVRGQVGIPVLAQSQRGLTRGG